MWAPATVVILAYFLGSISFAHLAARRAGVDITAVGSGNPGATNVGRVVGKRAGRIVLVADVLKGLLPTAATLLLSFDPVWVAATGLAATAGHCFPVWYRFHGGKGAATAAGAMLAAAPIAGIVAIALYVVLKRLTKRASVGSLAGAVGGAIVAPLTSASPEIGGMAIGIAVLVWARHHDNLVRLARGTEPES